ncbi:MAG: S9 family peptidase [Bacteroidia bacterium]|nr:S9 family peptidase [Bacteroidia bacterium]
MKKSLFLLFAVALLGLSACTGGKPAKKEITQYTIEQFYEGIRVGGGAWSPDESKLLIHSNETGISNLFEITIADGAKKQITFSEKESYYALSYVQSTGEILYAADQGGNEIDHIFLLKADGSSVDLTPGENEKADFMGWNEAHNAFFYLSNLRDPRFFDLYKMSASDWKSEMIYQNEDGWQVSAISWDENTLAFVKPVTTSESKLYLYDRARKSLKEISEPENPGTYSPSGFSKDNNSFYYITDGGKEFSYLVEYNLSTDERKVIYETNWDVMYSYLSFQETYRVIGINADGKNELKIFRNGMAEEVPFPAIPGGDVAGVGISPKEGRMRLTVVSSTAPANLYSYDFASKELKKLTNSSSPSINEADMVGAEVVRFKSFDGLEIPAIFYKPQTATADYPVPALVWVHGGPGGQSRVGFNPAMQYLINHGYAVLAVNNRGSSGYGKTFHKMDDQNHGDKDLKDCIWGKKWLASQPCIDSSQIGILGGSYGGYMTMRAMTHTPTEFKVGVNIYGVTNWLRTLKSIPPFWESFRMALYAEMGDPNTADSVRLRDISPLFHADQVKNPIMVLQGANDPRVLQIESDEIVEAVKANGVPVEYVIFPDEGHGFVKKENEIQAYRKILQFLDQYLKGIAPATTTEGEKAG